MAAAALWEYAREQSGEAMQLTSEGDSVTVTGASWGVDSESL